MLNDYENSKLGARYRPVSNYHGHNYMCGHAYGNVSDYVRQAVECDFEVVGISDHCVPPGGTCEPYMNPDTLVSEYLPQFAVAEKRYGKRITIKKGAEIEFFPGYSDYYENLLTKLDYLIMGQHEFLCDGARVNSFWGGTDEKNFCAYCDTVKQGIASGYFAFVAHPDIIFYRNPDMTDRMTEAFDGLVRYAKEHGVPLELNANGVRNHGFRYPTDALVDACKKYDAPVVVSSDCHIPGELCDGAMIDLYTYARSRGLNVVDIIDM